MYKIVLYMPLSISKNLFEWNKGYTTKLTNYGEPNLSRTSEYSNTNS